MSSSLLETSIATEDVRLAIKSGDGKANKGVVKKKRPVQQSADGSSATNEKRQSPSPEKEKVAEAVVKTSPVLVELSSTITMPTSASYHQQPSSSTDEKRHVGTLVAPSIAAQRAHRYNHLRNSEKVKTSLEDVLGVEEAPDGIGHSIYHAVKSNNEASLATLLDRWGHTEVMDWKNIDHHDQSPVYVACFNGNAKILRTLIAAGANPDTNCAYGKSALYVSCQNGFAECLEILISHGADCDKQEAEGWSPCFVCCVYGQERCLELLIEAHADINTKTRTGLSPVFASCSNDNENCLRLLITANADLNSPDNKGTKPLIEAKKKSPKCVALLLSAGVEEPPPTIIEKCANCVLS